MTPEEMQENIELLKRMNRSDYKILKIQLIPEDYDRIKSDIVVIDDMRHHPIDTLFGYPVECCPGLEYSRLVMFMPEGYRMQDDGKMGGPYSGAVGAMLDLSYMG